MVLGLGCVNVNLYTLEHMSYSNSFFTIVFAVNIINNLPLIVLLPPFVPYISTMFVDLLDSAHPLSHLGVPLPLLPVRSSSHSKVKEDGPAPKGLLMNAQRCVAR